MTKAIAAVGLAVLLAAGGCTSYYKITDPSTGKVYYTTEMKDKASGAIQIRDASNGNTVTLQTHEVNKINKEEYESGKAQAQQMPAANPASAATPPSAAPAAPAAAQPEAAATPSSAAPAAPASAATPSSAAPVAPATAQPAASAAQPNPVK